MKKIKNIYKFITLNKKWGVKKMKICGKKLIAGAAALAMACSMVGGFAAENTVSITKVEILNDGAEATAAKTFDNPTATTEGIKLTTAQLMRVTAVLKSGEANTAGEISFLSNISDSQALDNSTIQYVDQQTYTAGENEVVTITFRPRTTIKDNGIGTFVAKAGGTDVATAATFNYTVEAPKSNMTFTATTPADIKPGQSVSFEVKNTDGTAISGATLSATTGAEGFTPLTATTGDNGTASITFAAAGTYSVTATKEGYNTPTAITVNVVKNTTVPDEDKSNVEGNLSNALNGITQGGTSAALPGQAAGTGANYDIAYTVSAPEGKATYNEADKTITLNDGVFAAKVTVTANIGETISEQKVIYLVRDTSTNISFGNLALISTTAGEDAFASTTALSGANVASTVINEIKVDALNFALDRATPDSAIQSAIDYDMNNDVTLSEYRMLKLLFEGNENFTADKLTAQRSSWLPQQP